MDCSSLKITFHVFVAFVAKERVAMVSTVNR
jgi:hypothetical protein